MLVDDAFRAPACRSPPASQSPHDDLLSGQTQRVVHRVECELGCTSSAATFHENRMLPPQELSLITRLIGFAAVFERALEERTPD